ncbi:hypothetical protein FQR65_LT01973 [Abscondita terminalis]|nr:hypothetical protein FQR65_LT01973 [Abscondita terminalis]
MNNPNLYLQHVNKDILKRSVHFFDKYFHLVRQSDSKNKALDIGCGPGNVTHDILPHYFKYKIDKIIGIDKSKLMIQYATESYKSKNIIFKELDIMDEFKLKEFQGYFDHVFSLWCLQWVSDQLNLYKNIYGIMKPGGDLLVYYPAKSELYEVYRKVWHKSIYSEHIKDFSGMESYFHKSRNPVEDLKSLLKEVGFDVRLCELTKWRSISESDVKRMFNNSKTYQLLYVKYFNLEFLISINGAYDQLPIHLRDEFIEDLLQEMNKNVRQSDSKNKALDIGCGPGNVTHDILPHYFKYKMDKIIGIDKSKPMIQYATETYKSKNIIFKELDIMDEFKLKEFQGYFDHVFSLWCLQWVSDQLNLYKNIYGIMKPGGDLLVYYQAKTELYEVYRKVWHKSIYSEHIKDFSGMESYFHKSRNPVEDLKSLLKEVGFDVRLCELTKWRSISESDVKQFLISINGAYDQLPIHLRDDFIEDLLQEMNKNGRFCFKNQYFIDSEMFVVYVRKNE